MASPAQSRPLMESAPVGAALAFTSGTLSTFTFLNAGIFGTIQSGNVLSSAMSFSSGDWRRGLLVFMSIGGFFFGAIVGGMAVEALQRRGRQYSPFILGAEALLILVAAALWGAGAFPETQVGAHMACLLIAIPAGAQGTAFHKLNGMVYGNVAITAVVQGAANFIAQFFMARSAEGHRYYRDWTWRFLGVILGFAAGAAVGVTLGLWAGAPAATFVGTAKTSTWWVLLVPIATLLVLMVISARLARMGKNPDPSKGSGLVY